MAALLPQWPAGIGLGNYFVEVPVRLTEMGPGDEPEVFLITFQWVAMAAHWPPEHWTTLLAPYLTGQVQNAYCNLDPHKALDYF